MCGIWGCIGKVPLRGDAAAACIKRLHARGPEAAAQREYAEGHAVLGFTRLAINGLSPAGMQPLERGGLAVVCNGEIYNATDLAARWGVATPPGTSDCEVLPRVFKALQPVHSA